MQIYKILFLFLSISLYAEQSSYKEIIKEHAKKIHDKKFDVCNNKLLFSKNAEHKNNIEKSIIIRVALDEKHLSDASWKLNSKKGFIVSHNNQSKIFNNPNLYISYSGDSIIINGIKFRTHNLYIKPIEGLVNYNKNNYKGFFVISRLGHIMYLINHLDMEDYVESVLPIESVPNWPEEVNMASAIAFRTYGIRKLLDERSSKIKFKIKLPFDIKNTSIHQNYKGYKEFPKLKKCIEKTRGIILSQNNKPILAMFDICCGGVIPSKIHNFNFSKTPYLMRNYPCYYCKSCKSYEWEVKISAKDLESILRQEHKNLKDLKDIKITKKDNAGLVSELRIKGKHWFSMTGVRFKSLLKKLKSRCFSIVKNGTEFIIRGNGFGHHLGMCQWGALQMAKEGFKYKDILSFYYPGTTFMKICVKK